jgi:hypothetical protein
MLASTGIAGYAKLLLKRAEEETLRIRNVTGAEFKGIRAAATKMGKVNCISTPYPTPSPVDQAFLPSCEPQKECSAKVLLKS